MVLAGLSHLFLAMALADGGEGWSRFRGPNGSGVAAGGLPDSLAPGDAAWKVAVGEGYSSPVLDDEHVYLTTYEGRTLQTLCLDRASGEEVWKVDSPKPLDSDPRGPNSPVSSTPACDGEAVYVFFQNQGVLCYSRDGEHRWTCELGPFRNPYGMASSPIVAGDLVVMQCDHDQGSFLAAIDRKSGELRWRVERPGVTHGFSSPILYRDAEGREQLIVLGAYEVSGYDLRSGDKIWWFGGLAWQSKSTPVLRGDTVFVHSWMAGPSEIGLRKLTMSWDKALETFDKDDDDRISKEELQDDGAKRLWFLYDLDGDGLVGEEDWKSIVARGRADNGFYALQLGAEGDLSGHLQWRHNRSLPNIPSPIVAGDAVFLLKEEGILSALDPESGETLRSDRIEGAVEGYFASPVLVDGKLLTASHAGKVALIEATAEWTTEVVHDFGEEIWATPAVSDGQVFLRTKTALYCFE